MNFANQRLCVILRDTRGWPWSKIAERLHTLQGRGHHPSPRQCSGVYKAFSANLGHRRYQYHNCGRKPWKVTPDIERFIVRTLRAQRTRCICTSTTLQRAVMEHMHVHLEASTIRKILKKRGYRWLPRRQKPKHSPEVRAQRRAFAAEILAMGKRARTALRNVHGRRRAGLAAHRPRRSPQLLPRGRDAHVAPDERGCAS